MVSLTQRDTFFIEAQKDPELRPLRAFVFGERVREPIPGATTRSRLFDALRGADPDQFQEVVDDLERRKVSSDSDWIWDDCIVFLLLLGVCKFKLGDALADKLLQYRAKTTNPQVQRVNHAFEGIRRLEFALEGECAFIKCVYRTISESWVLSDSDCGKLYKQLTTPGFLEQLDPFLRLLAIRAFDLVIECRSASLDPGSWSQVLQKLQDDGAKLSLSQFLRLLKHLRIGVVLAIALSIPTIFGAGGLWSWWRTKPSVPKGVALSGPLMLHSQLADGTNKWAAPFLHYLEDSGSSPTNVLAKTLMAETDPFPHPTERFSIKGTFTLATNINAFCFLMHPVDDAMSSVPIEISCSGNGFIATIPPAATGDRLQFLVRGVLAGNANMATAQASFSVNASP